MLRELIPRFEMLPRHNPLIRFEREMENLMDRWVGREVGWEEFRPAVNVAETEKEYQVTVELPGLKPEEVKVEMINGELQISGERKVEKEEKGKAWHRVERRYGEFRRTLALPAVVNEAKIEAKFADGVLNVILPKTEEAKPRHIAVKAT